MHTKFQLSILIFKHFLKGGGGGGVRHPTKGRIAVHRRAKLNVYISFKFKYAYQISELHLNNKKRGTFGPMPGLFTGPGGVSPYICISLCSIFMSIMHTVFQPSILKWCQAVIGWLFVSLQPPHRPGPSMSGVFALRGLWLKKLGQARRHKSFEIFV